MLRCPPVAHDDQHERHRHHEQACSIARAVEVIGDRWTILVLRDAFKGIRRFDDFRRDLDIARPVLADRLKKLVEHGVLEKRLYQERPRRYEYRLTPMGRELSPILVALMRWGDHHLAGEAGPPTVLTHDCGQELRQGFYCPACRQVFTPDEIRSRPGPGATPSDAEPQAADTVPRNGATSARAS